MAVQQRDVFICFSKSRPGEAKVALALKHELEQLGLYAFEYEDWSWVAAGLTDREVDVDRRTLRAMLATSSVAVLISPHEGDATAGVQTEIVELRACGSPVILLHWSPWGWEPILEPERVEGLNIIWRRQGRSTNDRDIADNQCESVARQLAAGAWLACQVHGMQSRHPRTAGTLLERIPDGPYAPLLNFRLQQPAREFDEDRREVDLPWIARDVAANANGDDLRAFVEEWRGGTDAIAETLAAEARFELIRPLRTFHAACESLCVEAQQRLAGASSGTQLKNRGLMLVRLNRTDEAIEVLQQALDVVPDEERYEVYQAMALAQQQPDSAAAIRSVTSAIDCAPQLELACGLTYTRGVLHLNTGEGEAALADFSFVADRSTNTTLRHSALRARARLQTDCNDYDAAIADYTRVLDDAASTPRTAVSAWMDRGMLYRVQGRTNEAIADWTRAIDAADADPLQRFRTLEARAQLLEETGELLAAADDYETMSAFTNASPGYREELKRNVARLRRV
jgi:tetratricopeptide (TPR) repeat protein